jgi:flagellar hook assembly protein FlgD
VPGVFQLAQNYPNPFNPITNISFEVPERSFVSLSIFDMNGREVSRLVDEYRNPGAYRVLWNGKTETGARSSSGIYFLRMNAGKFNRTRKMLLLK